MKITLFKPCFFNSYLDPRFWQVDFERHLFPHEDVRVSRLLEQILEYIQLLSGEGGPLTPLLLSSICKDLILNTIFII